MVIALVGACAAYKPARRLAPETFGMTCPSRTTCVEDTEMLSDAKRLQFDAVAFVETNLAPFENPPRVLFCSTQDCALRFGDPRVKGHYFGTYGLVINPGGWQPHIVRHEMIHHLQNERFGMFQASYAMPRWFIEGMAYSLSEDPRDPLPRRDIEAFRARFDAWIAAGNSWRAPPENRTR